MEIDTIRLEAMALTPQERAQLAEQLLASLDNLSDAEMARLWAQEAADRAAELDSGLVARIPADVAREQALALLR
jgi:putative addiction module component (TIGR02574 family)